MMSNMPLCLLRSNHAANIGRVFLIPHRPAFSRNLAPREWSKCHEDREVDPVLNFLQIRRKTGHQCSWRSAYRVILRVTETVVVIHVGPELGRKKTGGVRRIFGA